VPLPTRITSADLITKISTNLGVNRKKSAQILNVLLDVLMDQVASGDPVKLAGFGKFYLKQREGRFRRNISTGEPVWVKARLEPRFEAGVRFRGQVAGHKPAQK
jgi:nucleoid DNA-binding protein